MITCSIHATEIASTHHRRRVRLQDPHRGNAEVPGDPREHDLHPGAVAESRWRRHRDASGTGRRSARPTKALRRRSCTRSTSATTTIATGTSSRRPETRLAISKLHNVWHPQIVYDVHQQGAERLAHVRAALAGPDRAEHRSDHCAAMQLIGTGMAADLTAAGKKRSRRQRDLRFLDAGAALPVLSRRAADSERIGQRPARQPDQREAGPDRGQTALGYNPRERSWNYLEPWMGGEWRLRDIIDYQLIAMGVVLCQAAVRREDLLAVSIRSGSGRWRGRIPTRS